MNIAQALEILGFSGKDEPSVGELKKRYRNLSLKNHPDKGGNSDIFLRINQAYRILIGEEKADDTVLPPPSQTDEMFTQVFQGFDELFSKFHGQKVHKPTKKRVRLNVDELFVGAVREMEFVQGETCTKCTGTGTGSTLRCVKCKGVGHFMVNGPIRNNTPSFRKVHCKKCRGRGTIGRGSASICGNCNGVKMEYKKVKKGIRIPRGIKHNARIIVGENTETPTELIIQHPNQTDTEWNGWVLNDDTRNIELTYTISLKDAMLGNTITIQHPNATSLKCVIPAGTQPNQIITFKDKGLPSCPTLKMPPTNAIVKINITIPKITDPEIIKQISTMFS